MKYWNNQDKELNKMAWKEMRMILVIQSHLVLLDIKDG